MTEPRAREDRCRLSGGEQAASEQVGDPRTTLTAASDTAGQPFQLMPPLTPDEYAALRDDIAEHGQRVPIDTDQHGRILDGHHRAQVCADLGIEPITRVVPIDDDEAGREHALSVNLSRRHLNRDQRRWMVERCLILDPGLSDRTHAGRCGVSPTTVGTIRAQLLADGQLSSLDSRTGADGKRRRAPHRRYPEPVWVHIPDTIEEADDRLAEIDRQVRANRRQGHPTDALEWERAAIVARFVDPGDGPLQRKARIEECLDEIHRACAQAITDLRAKGVHDTTIVSSAVEAFYAGVSDAAYPPEIPEADRAAIQGILLAPFARAFDEAGIVGFGIDAEAVTE